MQHGASSWLVLLSAKCAAGWQLQHVPVCVNAAHKCVFRVRLGKSGDMGACSRIAASLMPQEWCHIGCMAPLSLLYACAEMLHTCPNTSPCWRCVHVSTTFVAILPAGVSTQC